MKFYVIKILLTSMIILGAILLTLLIFPNFWILLLMIWIVTEILLVYIIKIWKIDNKNKRND
jgi:hypothetical protein